ncbi:MAG: hypothetical protein WC487_05970 [Candidatus Omnitrophota bacterium]
MKIELKRPIQLPAPDKRILRPGIHTVPDSLAAHWFIQGLINNGSIVVKSDTDKQQVLKKSDSSNVKPSAKPLVLEVDATPTPKVKKGVKIPSQLPSEKKKEIEEDIKVEEVIDENKIEEEEEVIKKPRKNKEKKKVKSLM